MTRRPAGGAAARGAVNDIGFFRRRPTHTGDERPRPQPHALGRPAITGAPSDYDGLADRIGDGRCVLIGEASAEIGEQLLVSAGTVHAHLENVYAKLGVSDKAAALATALRHGLNDQEQR